MATATEKLKVILTADSRRLESSFKTARNAIALFGAAVAAVTAKVARDSIKIASDFDENLNVVATAFGQNTNSVLDWAKDIGNEMNRAQSTMLKYAGSLQGMLAPMVGSRKEATKMSTSLAELTVDLASFYNLAEDDALLKLQSALAGEVEPLRRLGINMNETALKAFAMSQGIKTNIKDMSEAEKTMLRYKFIMEATTLAQGDAIKTQDSWANQVRAISEDWTEVQRVMGDTLKKALEPLIKKWGAFMDDLSKDPRFIQAVVADTILSIIGIVKTVGSVVSFVKASWRAGENSRPR